MPTPRVRYLINKFLESFPIYHPKVLKKLFIKGYTGLVLKVLVQLSKSLDAAHSAPVYSSNIKILGT